MGHIINLLEWQKRKDWQHQGMKHTGTFLPSLLVGMQSGTAILEKSFEVSYKHIITWFSSTIYIYEKWKLRYRQNLCT